MTINYYIEDLVNKYMAIGPYWKLVTYVLTVFFMLVIVRWGKRNEISAGKCILIIMLFLYLITVYVSTVIVRSQISGEIVQLRPFLSWQKAMTGDEYRIMMVVENIMMLMPIGFVLSFVYSKKRYSVKIIFWGFIFSLFIEVSQLVFQRGLFEIDDLINNTIGVIIGVIIVDALKKILSLRKQKTNRWGFYG